MPRPYRLGQRQAASAQTRARILAAARELLMVPDNFSGFSVDAVARQADVARMTVYYQFGSKIGLLEALSDDLAARGEMERLPEAFQQPDPLDPDFEHVIRGRDERRRTGLLVIVGRLSERHGAPAPEDVERVVDILHT